MWKNIFALQKVKVFRVSGGCGFFSVTFCSVSISSVTRLTPPEAVSQSVLVDREPQGPIIQKHCFHEFTQVLAVDVLCLYMLVGSYRAGREMT